MSQKLEGKDWRVTQRQKQLSKPEPEFTDLRCKTATLKLLKFVGEDQNQETFDDKIIRLLKVTLGHQRNFAVKDKHSLYNNTEFRILASKAGIVFDD